MSLHHSLMQIRAAANTSTSSSERVAPEEERPAAKKRALHAEMEGEKEKEEGEEKGEEEGEEEGEEAGEPPLRALFSTTEPRSLVELAYQMLVGEMRDKVSWERKVLNPEIADKWRTEAIAGFRGAAEADVNARLAAARAKGAHAARQARLIGDQFFGLMSSSRVQEIRAELESEAAADLASATAERARLSTAEVIQSFTAHGSRAVQQVKWEAEQPAPRQAAVIGTFAADDVLPAPLIDELSAGFDRLASVGPKDWHPGSNEQVLDLVHPSLFCYERGRSNVVAPAEQRPVPPSLPDGPWSGLDRRRDFAEPGGGVVSKVDDDGLGVCCHTRVGGG